MATTTYTLRYLYDGKTAGARDFEDQADALGAYMAHLARIKDELDLFGINLAGAELVKTTKATPLSTTTRSRVVLSAGYLGGLRR